MVSLARRFARSRPCVMFAIGLVLSFLLPPTPVGRSASADPTPPEAIAPPVGPEALIDLQYSLWLQLYGSADEPNLCYALDAATFNGPGDYVGENAYAQPMSVRVVLTTEPITVVEGATRLTVWSVLGFVRGTTGVSLPVAGVVLRASGSRGTETLGFSPLASLSAAEGEMLETAEKPAGVYDGLMLTAQQLTCAARCADSYALSKSLAMAQFGVAVLVAGAALAAAILRCWSLIAGPPGFNLLISGVCFAAALGVYVIVADALRLRLSSQLMAALAEYLACLRGCGIHIKKA